MGLKPNSVYYFCDDEEFFLSTFVKKCSSKEEAIAEASRLGKDCHCYTYFATDEFGNSIEGSEV